LQTQPFIYSGDSTREGPGLVFDLPSLMEKIKQEDAWKMGQRNAITLLKTDTMRLVLIALRSGEEINFLQSDNLICLQLLEGRSEFHAKKEKIILKPGHILALHENIEHSLVALNETIFLLTVGNCNINSA